MVERSDSIFFRIFSEKCSNFVQKTPQYIQQRYDIILPISLMKKIAIAVLLIIIIILSGIYISMNIPSKNAAATKSDFTAFLNMIDSLSAPGSLTKDSVEKVLGVKLVEDDAQTNEYFTFYSVDKESIKTSLFRDDLIELDFRTPRKQTFPIKSFLVISLKRSSKLLNSRDVRAVYYTRGQSEKAIRIPDPNDPKKTVYIEYARRGEDHDTRIDFGYLTPSDMDRFDPYIVDVIIDQLGN